MLELLKTLGKISFKCRSFMDHLAIRVFFGVTVTEFYYVCLLLLSVHGPPQRQLLVQAVLHCCTGWPPPTLRDSCSDWRPSEAKVQLRHLQGVKGEILGVLLSSSNYLPYKRKLLGISIVATCENFSKKNSEHAIPYICGR